MSGFVVIAGLLTLAVLIALLYPLLRKREGLPESWRAAGIAGLLILVGGAALYPTWSNFKWHEPQPAADSPEAMVGRLARRLERQPDDIDGWLRLGRSYGVLGQHELSARAYQRADTLAKGKNPEALMGLAEALVVSEKSDLGSRAGRLFEQALELDGASVKALFYSAFAARHRNELPLARERFERLLTANPPEEVARIISEQISEIDALSRMVGDGAAAPTSGGTAMAAAAPATQAAPAAAAVTVPLRVTVSASVADKAAAGAPLFVLARIPGQRGPPLAARRLDARFPQEVDLLSTDAMIAGTGFAAGQELEIEARIANGGGASSRSGDPFGVIRVTAGSKQRAAIEINQLKP